MWSGWPVITATALLLGVFPSPASAADLAAAQEDTAGSTSSAEIELRKVFRPAPRSGRQPTRAAGRARSAVESTGNTTLGQTPIPRLDAAAAALGEALQDSGTLRLPGIGGRELVIQEALTPVLEFGTGRRVIVDLRGVIAQGTAEEISRSWPGYRVVHPAQKAGLRSVIGSLLDAAGYESVLRSTPLTFGRGVTVRFTPDFVVLRHVRDLLEGETHAISVVEPTDALPAELRELAADQRVRIVELTPDGSPAGSDRASWRDPAGRVTTMGTDRFAPVLGEIAVELGFATETRGRFTTPPGEQPARQARIAGRGRTAVLVLEDPNQSGQAAGADPAGAQIVIAGPDDLQAAIGALLGHFGVPAIGPVVELSRAADEGEIARFVITVPGWLAQAGGRRLLITGASIPEMVRLFLTREKIDIFEFRIP